MSSRTVIHEIRFSAEAMALLERIAVSLAHSLQPPSPASMPVRTAAPGVSAPLLVDSASPPAEGPSRAASGTYAGCSEKTPGVSFRVWLTPARQAILEQCWPTMENITSIMQKMADAGGPPLPAKSVIGQRAFLLGLKRPDGFHHRRRIDAEPASAPAPASPKKRVLSAEHLEKIRQAAAKGRAALAAKRTMAPAPVDAEPAASAEVEFAQIRKSENPPPSSVLCTAGVWPSGFVAALIGSPSVIPPSVPPSRIAEPPASPAEPVDRREIMRRIAAIKPPAVDPGKPKGEPIVASQETIRNWAISRGVDMGRGFDLDAANRKAAAIGHPGFALRTRLG